MAAGKRNPEYLALFHSLLAGSGENVGGPFGHGRRIFVNMQGKMYGTAWAFHSASPW